MYGTVDYVALLYIMVLVRSTVHDSRKDCFFHVTYVTLDKD